MPSKSNWPFFLGNFFLLLESLPIAFPRRTLCGPLPVAVSFSEMTTFVGYSSLKSFNFQSLDIGYISHKAKKSFLLLTLELYCCWFQAPQTLGSEDNFLLEPFPLSIASFATCLSSLPVRLSTHSLLKLVWGAKGTSLEKEFILGKFNQAVSFYFYFLYVQKDLTETEFWT